LAYQPGKGQLPITVAGRIGRFAMQAMYAHGKIQQVAPDEPG